MEQGVTFPPLSGSKRSSSVLNEAGEYSSFQKIGDKHQNKTLSFNTLSTTFSNPFSDYDQLRNLSRMIDDSLLRDAAALDYFQGFQGSL